MVCPLPAIVSVFEIVKVAVTTISAVILMVSPFTAVDRAVLRVA